jgi:hypothetical protein
MNIDVSNMKYEDIHVSLISSELKSWSKSVGLNPTSSQSEPPVTDAPSIESLLWLSCEWTPIELQSGFT